MMFKNDMIISCVESDLPEPEEYFNLLQWIHKQNRYSNFGALSKSFAAGLLKEFGLDGEACVVCSSATAGLSAALLASGCRGGVLVPGFTFPATFGAVLAAGLHPLVMDVAESNWAIAADALDQALARTGAEAVILVSPFGLAVDFTEHVRICRRRGVVVVIDSAAGLGGTRRNSCALPDVYEVFSLHATKPLGIGEGGAVFCAPDRCEVISSALNFGLPSAGKPPGPRWGFNGKLSELHAAVGLAQLQRYRPILAGRQRFAALYQGVLEAFPVTVSRDRPVSSPWQVFPLLMPSEEALDATAEALLKTGVETRRYYRPSLSQWSEADLVSPCPVSETLAARMLALPIRSIAQDATAEPILSRVVTALETVFERSANA